MDIIKQTLGSDDIKFVIIGLILILIAILIGVFKKYWLIGGINTMPKKELAKIDLDYLVKWFGIFMGIFGFIIFLSPFIFRYLNIMKYLSLFFGISTLVFGIFLIWYLRVFKKDRIYKKN